jgi:hypothetical protein
LGIETGASDVDAKLADMVIIPNICDQSGVTLHREILDSHGDNEDCDMLLAYKGHALAYWLRLFATSRKIASLRPDEVNEIFQFT